MSKTKPLEPLQVGVMFWTGGSLGVNATPDEIAGTVSSFGVSCGQLGFHGEAVLDTPPYSTMWQVALEKHQVQVVTAFAGFSGESYASIPVCTDTVGFVPPTTRREREQRMREISDFAKILGIPGLAAHIGCLPQDHKDPEYREVCSLIQRLCDHCANNEQTFALETGQEPAEELLAFIKDVNRPNLGVNFDPANMILYGSGEPIHALEKLQDHIISVHCKDGSWPESDGEWGHETPLGEGDVGFERYIATLKRIGFTGPLIIEREIVGQEQQEDIRRAISLLNTLRV